MSHSRLSSGSITCMRRLGAGHRRSVVLVAVQRYARLFDVLIAEVLVKQKIIMGFLFECFAMISGSLYFALAKVARDGLRCVYLVVNTLSKAKSFCLMP